MNQPELLNARAAAARLGVKLDTLYAYVSRGLLRSVAVPGSRERHYRREDIDAFRATRGQAKAGVEAAGPAMPVIESGISLIDGGRLYYRGQDAVRLSDRATLEETAALLWGTAVEIPKSRTAGAKRKNQAGTTEPESLGFIPRCQMRLAAVPGTPVSDASREALPGAGQRILRELVACLTQHPASGLPAHVQLTARWQIDAFGADLIRRCLVLLADHELNTSTLTARCVASTGATLPMVVSAALGALSGPRHGGAASRAEALFQAEGENGDPLMLLASRLARGEELPGISHPLYPEGDPRAVAILYALSLAFPQARRLVGYRPNVDFALAAVTSALGLPRGAALGLFVIGRSVGWIAHAIEQYESGLLIRPRARYTGPRPETETSV